MKLITATPMAALCGHVRCFEERDADVGPNAIVYPMAARPEQFLEFYLQEPYVVRSRESGLNAPAPRAVVVGPCTYRRADLVLRGRLLVFTIHFQPCGFHGLFGVPMPALVDQAYEARSVLGAFVPTLEQQLADASNFDERIRIATASLLRRAASRTPDAIALVANRVLHERGVLDVRDAARFTTLSVRQFERRFREQVGVSPKHFAGIVRFNAALQAKLRSGQRLWTDIAHESSYFDQMHMVHDFRRFSGESPTRLFGDYGAMSAPWR